MNLQTLLDRPGVGDTVPRDRTGARRSHLRIALEGVRDMTPMVVGVVPFALAIGSAIGASSLSEAEGLFSAGAILAGSAQMAAIHMLDTGTAAWVVVVSALVINARLLLYGAALAPWFAGQPVWRRVVLAVLVIDQMYFLCSERFRRGDLDPAGRVAYYVGAGAWLMSAWVAAQAAAILLGASAPAWLGLELAAPLVLVGLLATSMSSRAAVSAAVASGLVVVVGAGLPLHSAVLVATIGGVAVGRLCSGLFPSPQGSAR
jgi:predicted branched-subunit amino acid permease